VATGSARFTIEARPSAVSIDAAHTAVVVVDMQNDFASLEGMFGCAGINVADIRATIEPTRRVLASARQAGIRVVVYLKMAFRSDLSDAGAPQSPNWLKHLPLKAGEHITAPDGSPSRVLIRDTWNTDIVAELTPAPGDAVVYKHRYSGFFETDLDAILKGWEIGNLVFTGCTTSVCVESTIKDAMFRDYHCLLLDDCTAEAIGANLPRTNHDATLLVIELLVGSVSNSATWLAALEHPAAATAAP
jgi:ureidoacrylate peracid hydrolase